MAHHDSALCMTKGSKCPDGMVRGCSWSSAAATRTVEKLRALISEWFESLLVIFNPSLKSCPIRSNISRIDPISIRSSSAVAATVGIPRSGKVICLCRYKLGPAKIDYRGNRYKTTYSPAMSSH
eukprot:671942-Rhodomonas_salina.1